MHCAECSAANKLLRQGLSPMSQWGWNPERLRARRPRGTAGTAHARQAAAAGPPHAPAPAHSFQKISNLFMRSCPFQHATP